MDLIGEEEKRELLEVLDSGYLFRYGSPDDPAFKAKVYQLEQRVAQLMGVEYAVAVNSGTTALLVALGGLGIGPGDEVIVPGYTFIASMSSVIYARAIPILAEIDETLNLDPDDVRQRITPRTKAIMVVHMLGNPARLDELKAIADEHGLLLVEDCAQAFGATYKGRRVGSIGDVGTYSFNIFKTITAGDGGMVVTSDEPTYRRCFGFHDQGHSPLRTGIEVGSRPFVGLDFRMTELTAAVLLAQLAKLDGLLVRLRESKRRFKAGIADLPGIRFRALPDPDGECSTILTVLMPSEDVARKIAGELGTKVVADSGWHVYSNMEQILEQRTITAEGCPFTCPYYKGGEVKYWKGMLPQTDDILSRAINISIGVSDAGLGSGFGVTIRDSDEQIDERIEQFHSIAGRYL
ncbi:MAG: DegT/DnrJ/EryC1/StrS family aminotransferase [Chloroflexi bacterium]|nr:DegT/DnrJ/EryC1/StrS family aminotransferase [Chloroflexota bacterium]